MQIDIENPLGIIFAILVTHNQNCAYILSKDWTCIFNIIVQGAYKRDAYN